MAEPQLDSDGNSQILSKDLRHSLTAAKLEFLAPVLLKLGVESTEDLNFFTGKDLEEYGVKLVQQRRFDAWKQQLIGACGREENGRDDVQRHTAPLKSLGDASFGSSSAESPFYAPGEELEEYVRRLLSKVTGTKVQKPNRVPRLQICCQEHKHKEISTCTSQPDALLQLSHGKIVVEVKDYQGKLPRREVDKLLSDQKSHCADHAMLFLGAGSRLTSRCLAMMKDHQVHVVQLREPSRDSDNEDMVREALEVCRSPNVDVVGLSMVPESDSSSESTPCTARSENAAVDQCTRQPLAVMEVRRFKMTGNGTLEHVRVETVVRREIHDMGLDPEHGWEWIKVEFHSKGSKDDIDPWRDPQGVQDHGRRFFLASVSKGDFARPAVAWAASPPGDTGADALEAALGWGVALRLQAPTEKRPHPLWLLRARVKQLFSASRPLNLPCLQIVAVDNVLDNQGNDRTDGSAEADPEIFRAAAMQLVPESRGSRRTVSQSFQLRDGGVKGTSLAAPRLEGTMRFEAPKSMCKFDGLSLGPHLRVVTFSVIRPTNLSLNAILRLEALGVPGHVFVDAQKARLQELTGRLTKRQALRLLYVDMDDLADTAEGWGRLSRDGTHYLGCFAELLLAGFDVTQQPLLKVLRKQRQHELERALRQLSISGVWSGRGQPEPQSKGGNRELRGNEIFCLVPDVDGTWRALVGPVLVYQSVDLDPMAIRLAEGVDSEGLRAKCPAGVLIFSTQGTALQAGLGWDFDGDYYTITDNQALIPPNLKASHEIHSETPRLARQSQTGNNLEMPKLAEVNANFLSEFHAVDKMSLLHYQWQLLAGANSNAAMTEKARKVSSLYAMAVDVEKGGPRPEELKGLRAEKWDFMKNAKPNAGRSPTAAGEIYRMARELFQKFAQTSEAEACVSRLVPDPDLEAAWEAAQARLGIHRMQNLEQLAKKLRKELNQKVKEKMERQQAEAAEDNPENPAMQQESEELFRQWMDEKRREVESSVEQFGTSLTDLALTAWHQKYVEEGTARKFDDPDQFPWTIFNKELCREKSIKHPCRLPQMERYRRLLLDLCSAAEAVKDENTKVEVTGPVLAKALDASRKDLARRNCRTCAENLSRDHAGFWPDDYTSLQTTALAPLVLNHFHVIRHGSKVRMPCSELRYTKKEIINSFSSGPETGEAVNSLVDRLLSSDADQVLTTLCLVAVRYHGHVFVVEGNRRLWALRQAELKSGKGLAINVDIQDLYLGKVKGQPALRVFWQKFETRNFGKSIEIVVEPFAATTPRPQDQCGKPSEGDEKMPFGKHKGKTFSAIKHEDPGYCGWVLTEDNSRSQPAFRSFARYLRGQSGSNKSSAESYTKGGTQSKSMSFGKHKGKTFGQVQREDPGYCTWVLQNEHGGSSQGLKDFAKFLRNDAA